MGGEGCRSESEGAGTHSRRVGTELPGFGGAEESVTPPDVLTPRFHAADGFNDVDSRCGKPPVVPSDQQRATRFLAGNKPDIGVSNLCQR